MESIKCNLCRKTKPSNEFLKNGKTLKSCVACRDKNKTVKEPVALPTKPAVKPEPVKPEPVDPVPVKPAVNPEPVKPEPVKPEPKELINELIPRIHSIQVPRKGWKILSGKWIKEDSERELHKKLTQKMMIQFKKRAAKPVHEYLMKNVFVDIRDLYTS